MQSMLCLKASNMHAATCAAETSTHVNHTSIAKHRKHPDFEREVKSNVSGNIDIPLFGHFTVWTLFLEARVELVQRVSLQTTSFAISCTLHSIFKV